MADQSMDQSRVTEACVGEVCCRGTAAETTDATCGRKMFVCYHHISYPCQPTRPPYSTAVILS